MNRFNLSAHLTDIYQHFSNRRERPVIGITGNYGELTCKLSEGYYKQIDAAGGVPFIIPPLTDEQTLTGTLDRIDALLLSGGADINPLFQGDEPVPQLGGINAERDLPELLITRLAFHRQMPILGICRGIQTLATALDGRVTQHIETPIKHSQDADRAEPTHTVAIVPQSLLSRIFAPNSTEDTTEALRLAVNSLHHQAVGTPGPHLRVAATAPDGIIEAIESSEHKPVVGVQWHPECMGADGQPLFQWLVGEARLYRQTCRLHDQTLTLDTHCDTPMLFPQGIRFNTRDKRILVDLPKMTEGRLDATIMVAYLPQDWKQFQPDGILTPRQYADQIFDEIGKIVDDSKGSVALARTPDDLLRNKRLGCKSIMLGIENGLALEGSLDNLHHFAQRGIVYMTLCHNGDNDICDAASRSAQTHGGLSDFGRKVVTEMNRLGIIVDLSHGGERSFYDALEVSAQPIVCSHSSARALCNHPRNLTDDQMRQLARKGGVCQVTLYPGFLRTSGEASILDALQHLEHAIKLMGIDHVGLGSDFDGDGGVPGLADASEYFNFTRHLLRRRYSQHDIELICGGNFLRVMRQVQGGNEELGN